MVPQKGTFFSRIRREKLYDQMYVREVVELFVLEELRNRIDSRGIFRLRLLILDQKRLFEEKMPRD